LRHQETCLFVWVLGFHQWQLTLGRGGLSLLTLFTITLKVKVSWYNSCRDQQSSFGIPPFVIWGIGLWDVSMPCEILVGKAWLEPSYNLGQPFSLSEPRNAVKKKGNMGTFLEVKWINWSNAFQRQCGAGKGSEGTEGCWQNLSHGFL
jgi:hypothetical protein